MLTVNPILSESLAQLFGLIVYFNISAFDLTSVDQNTFFDVENLETNLMARPSIGSWTPSDCSESFALQFLILC